MPVSLMRLELENFRAFRGKTLNLAVDGKNLLIYGENGAGKTSIWTALDAMLAATLAPDPETSSLLFNSHKYKWSTHEELASVKITLKDQELQETESPEKIYEWSSEATPYSEDIFQSSAKTRACLDYRALWETYFLHRQEDKVDIWPLLVNSLLPHYKPIISNNTLGEEWKTFLPFIHEPKRIRNASGIHILRTAYSDFISGLSLTLFEVQQYAHKILEILAPGLKFQWELEQSNFYNPTDKNTIWQMRPHHVWLKVSLNGRDFDNHHNLLNESRLSALAISIYLGASLLNGTQSRSSWKVLALDDVLIGFDMSHRMPMLDVLEKYFADWQIFLLTYDRYWYEIAKMRLSKDKWKNFEFFASEDTPVWSEDSGLLEKSKNYLLTSKKFANIDQPIATIPDDKASGVYARLAFEVMMKRFFDKEKLPIRYRKDNKHMAGELWLALQDLEVEEITRVGAPPTRRRLINESLKNEINRARMERLNPLCHSGFDDIYRHEIKKTIEILDQLSQILEENNLKICTKPLNEDHSGKTINNHIQFNQLNYQNLKTLSYLANKEISSRNSLCPGVVKLIWTLKQIKNAKRSST